MTEPIAALFDTHAHIISDDPARYPPSASAKTSGVVPFTIDDLVAGIDDNGVVKACVVQRFHYYRNDNSYVIDGCAAHPDRLTPVVMVDGDDPQSPEQLRKMHAHQPLGGIRFGGPSIDSYDTAWLNSPGVMRIWEQAAELGLPVTLIMFEPHVSYNLPALQRIAERFPELPIIIDHLGALHGLTPAINQRREMPSYRPYITAPDYGVTPALRDMRACPNVHYKFSGINLRCLRADGIDASTFLRYFVDEFGVERIVCGTDIGQTKGPYARLTSELRAATGLLDVTERDLVLAGNAARIYANWPA